MANNNRKQKKPVQKDWLLPTYEVCEKGDDDQDADLRKRLLRYAKQHPDRFQGPRPIASANSYYMSLIRSYLTAAQYLHRCATARDLLRLPTIDMRQMIYEDVTQLGDCQEYFDSLDHELRMVPPMDGVTEFTVGGVIRPDDDDESSGTILHVQVVEPGRKTDDGSTLRTVRITQFYKSPDLGLHPCMVTQVNLYARTRGSDPKTDEETGEPIYYDIMSVDRENGMGLVDYLIAVKPHELDWTPEQIDFWQEVVLTHAAHSYIIAQKTHMDFLMAKIYTSSINMFAYAMSRFDPVETEDLSPEAVRRAARPRYLKPSPDDDVRKVWKFGPLEYRARELPVLAPGFPDLRDAGADDDTNGEEITHEEETGPEQAAGDMADPGTG